jgi:hypothetical protein
MQDIRVKKDELIDKLKLNREAHVSEFTEAHAAWVETRIVDYKARIKSLKETSKDIGAGGGLEPVSQEKSYDRAIKMLEMSIDTEIVLPEHEFQQYVLDEWQWSQNFKSVTATYAKSK